MRQHRYAENYANLAKEGVLSLLSLKYLDALMLWNPHLKEKTFRAIVSRFRDQVDAVSVEDCYHRYEAQSHVGSCFKAVSGVLSRGAHDLGSQRP